MRVLVLTVVHVAGDARIRHRQIQSLLDAGHTVSYVAPFTDAELEAESSVDGLTCLAVPRASGRRRLAPLAAAGRLLRAQAPEHDLVLLHDPELLTIAEAAGGTPVVWDVHEDLVGSLADKPWLPSAVRGPVAATAARMERLAEGRHHLLLAEHGYQERFSRLHPVVPNVPPLPSSPGPAAIRDEVVHLGRVSRLRGAEELVRVGRELAPRGIALHLFGPVDQDQQALVDGAHKAGDVVAHGFVPNDQALVRLGGAIAGLALLHDHPNYRRSLPTKLVEYLAAGIPVITTPLDEAVRVVEQSGAGSVVPFGDVDGVVTQVLSWHRDRDEARRLGAVGRAAAEDRWSWAAHAPRFVSQLEAWASQG